jgi:FkbM family methyltransferase
MSVISRLRECLPESWRSKLKEMTARHPALTSVIALLYGLSLRLGREPYITGKRVPKIFVIPDIYAVDCALDVFVREVYERFYRLREGDVVIDVGAHVGMFTVKAAMSVGERGKVVAIEPVEENLRLLRKNVELHKLNNVVIIGRACSRERGRAKLVKSELSGTHQLRAVSKEPEFPVSEVEVEVTTIDDVCRNLGLLRIDFLKIDVEGAELKVLRGAEEGLKVTRNIAMELHYEGEREEVKDYLEKRGFEVKIVGSMLYASRR